MKPAVFALTCALIVGCSALDTSDRNVDVIRELFIPPNTYGVCISKDCVLESDGGIRGDSVLLSSRMGLWGCSGDSVILVTRRGNYWISYVYVDRATYQRICDFTDCTIAEQAALKARQDSIENHYRSIIKRTKGKKCDN